MIPYIVVKHIPAVDGHKQKLTREGCPDWDTGKMFHAKVKGMKKQASGDKVLDILSQCCLFVGKRITVTWVGADLTGTPQYMYLSQADSQTPALSYQLNQHT